SSSMACGTVCRQPPEAGARCVNRARRDLRGGCPVRGIPTVTQCSTWAGRECKGFWSGGKRGRAGGHGESRRSALRRWQ
ncbi:hypothetical protein FVF58_12290, partial [Paraburkholderia panacisoli]